MTIKFEPDCGKNRNDESLDSIATLFKEVIITRKESEQLFKDMAKELGYGVSKEPIRLKVCFHSDCDKVATHLTSEDIQYCKKHYEEWMLSKSPIDYPKIGSVTYYYHKDIEELKQRLDKLEHHQVNDRLKINVFGENQSIINERLDKLEVIKQEQQGTNRDHDIRITTLEKRATKQGEAITHIITNRGIDSNLKERIEKLEDRQEQQKKWIQNQKERLDKLEEDVASNRDD